MAMLTRLRINTYRNIVSGTELTFSPSLNVLLGRNATGKTTLLKLISTILISDFTGLLNEEFAIEYDLHVSDGHLTAVLKNQRRRTDAAKSSDAEAALLAIDPASFEQSVEVRIHLLNHPELTIRS